MWEGLLGLAVLAIWWFFMGDTIMGWVRAPFRWINGLAKDHAERVALRSRELDPDD